MIRAVVFDLDGVIRHFDPELVADVEARHALAMGTLLETAFADPGLSEVTTGRITREAWVTGVGEALGAPAAAREWGGQPPRVDAEMLELADELRGRGRTGPDDLRQELVRRGVL